MKVLIFLLISTYTYSQSSDSLNTYNSLNQKEGYWKEKYLGNSFGIDAYGSYEKGLKIGSWRYSVYYNDYNVTVTTVYNKDCSVILFENLIEEKGGQGAVVMSPDSSIFKINNSDAFKIKRWCEKRDEYKCYEFNPNNNALKMHYCKSLFEALNFITFSNYDPELVSYFLKRQ